MAERIIGILGGMGPEATADLFREITRLTPAKSDQDHLHVLIYSNPSIPDRTRAILEGTEDPLPALIATARRLEGAGAGIIVMPCNTAHFFLPKLQAALRVPVLNMIEESLREVRRSFPGMGSVGLLASTGTVRSGIYESVFNRESLRILVPDASVQEQVHRAIYDVKAGSSIEAARGTFDAAAAALASKGAGVIVHGCTEIPLAYPFAVPMYPCLNPTRVLAQASVDWALMRRC